MKERNSHFNGDPDLSRTAIAAMATGIATAALNASITYANERHQFGKPITAFQAISFMRPIWLQMKLPTAVSEGRLVR